MDNEIPKYRASKQYKKKTILIECRYTGNSELWLDIFHGGRWFTWKKYATTKDAQKALKSLAKNPHFEYRLT